MKKYVVEYYPNPDMATIHLSKRVVGEKRIELGDKSVFLIDPTKNPPAFAKEIVAIEGVVKLSIRGYEVGISKGKAFDWLLDILPKVLPILTEQSVTEESSKETVKEDTEEVEST